MSAVLASKPGGSVDIQGSVAARVVHPFGARSERACRLELWIVTGAAAVGPAVGVGASVALGAGEDVGLGCAGLSTCHSPMAPSATTTAAAAATLAYMFIWANLRGAGRPRRCRVVAMVVSGDCSTQSGACSGGCSE